MENEERSTSLVTDIASLLGNIAVGSQHTPALYGAFLKALISVKTNPSRSGSPSVNMNSQLSIANAKEATSQDLSLTTKDVVHMDELHDAGQPFLGYDSSLQMQNYRTVGEMGPVADLSTFPPMMAAPLSTEYESSAMLSMDSILSPGFWDNVLIPGE